MSAIPLLPQEEALKAILARVGETAVLPHAVYKIMEISGSESAAISELENAIVVDPGFSARLLAHANCAFYCLPKQVTSIKEAVLFLGFKKIRQMAMTVGVFDLFAGKTDKESLRRRRWWRNSIDTAVISRWLVLQSKKGSPDEAYTVGLFHCLGKTLLDRSEPGAYDKVESLILSEMSTIGAEEAIFGCNHVQVGMEACKHWGLPEPIVESMNYAVPVSAEHAYAEQIAIVAIGQATAIAAVAGLSENSAPVWALELLGLSEDEGITWVEKGIAFLANTGSPSMG